MVRGQIRWHRFENRLDGLIVNGFVYLTISFTGLLHGNCGLLLKYRHVTRNPHREHRAFRLGAR
jgi:hypothetical protein